MLVLLELVLLVFFVMLALFIFFAVALGFPAFMSMTLMSPVTSH